MRLLFAALIAVSALSPVLAAGQSTRIVEDLDDRLVAVEGNRLAPFDAGSLGETKYFLFYFGAGWSGASSRLVPQLVNIHRELKAKGVEVEFIYVSADRNEGELKDTLIRGGIAWPAVAFGRVGETIERIGYEAREIPTLVLYGADGRKLSDTYEEGEFVGPARVIQDLYALTGVSSVQGSNPEATPRPAGGARKPDGRSPSGTDFDSFFGN